jgi:hypothetical protein
MPHLHNHYIGRLSTRRYLGTGKNLHNLYSSLKIPRKIHTNSWKCMKIFKNSKHCTKFTKIHNCLLKNLTSTSILRFFKCAAAAGRRPRSRFFDLNLTWIVLFFNLLGPISLSSPHTPHIFGSFSLLRSYTQIFWEHFRFNRPLGSLYTNFWFFFTLKYIFLCSDNFVHNLVLNCLKTLYSVVNSLLAVTRKIFFLLKKQK